MRTAIVGLCCVSWVAFAAVDLSPPRSGHYAKDTTGKIPASTIAELDALATTVSNSGNGQLGVLVVATTNGVPPRKFATDVFNRWGIGHREYDNGILLFVALDDRKAEIVLGDGVTHLNPQTDVIMRDQVVANFKAGQPAQALLDGATALAGLLNAGQMRGLVDHAPHPEVPLTAAELAAEAKVAALFEKGELPDPSPRGWVIDLTGEVASDTVHALERLPNELYANDNGRQLFVLFFRTGNYNAFQVRERASQVLAVKHPRAALLGINLLQGETSFRLPDELREDDVRAAMFEGQVEEAARSNPLNGNEAARDLLINGVPPRSTSEVVGEAFDRYAAVFWTMGGSVLLGGLLFGRRWNRYRSRSCRDCQRPRQMLPAGAEDQHLTEGQRAEQNVKSIDYDVWWCGVCRSVLVLDNSSWFSGYSKCTGCRNKTLKSTSTTLQAATTYSGGLVQIDERCAHCNYANTYTRTTARLSDNSSSSSSSSSSFGGGSSSGGGSSGSW